MVLSSDRPLITAPDRISNLLGDYLLPAKSMSRLSGWWVSAPEMADSLFQNIPSLGVELGAVSDTASRSLTTIFDSTASPDKRV